VAVAVVHLLPVILAVLGAVVVDGVRLWHRAVVGLAGKVIPVVTASHKAALRLAVAVVVLALVVVAVVVVQPDPAVAVAQAVTLTDKLTLVAVAVAAMLPQALPLVLVDQAVEPRGVVVTLVQHLQRVGVKVAVVAGVPEPVVKVVLVEVASVSYLCQPPHTQALNPVLQ
jgi:hypothetical protein